MTLSEVLENTAPSWMDGGESPVLYTALHLSRNLAGLDFPAFGGSAVRNTIAAAAAKAVAQWNESGEEELSRFPLAGLSDTEKEVFAEKGLIPPEGEWQKEHSQCYVSKDGHLSLYVNGQDGLCLSLYQGGSRMRKLWKEASRIDDRLGEALDYAFDDEFGYLTASPGLAGTGLRLTARLFLPGLAAGKAVRTLSDELERKGFILESAAPEGWESEVPLYDMTSTVSMGVSEDDLAREMEEILSDVKRGEKSLRAAWFAKRGSTLKDAIWRAMGVLKYARLLSAGEAAQYLARVELGMEEDLIPKKEAHFFQKLLMMSKPSWVRYNTHKEEASEEEENLWRAAIIREAMEQEGL